MAGINLQGGYGAGGAVDALRVLVAENLRAKAQADQVAQEQARLAEIGREADQRNVVDLGHLGVAKTQAQLQAERDAQAKRHSELFDPLDYRQKEALIAGTQATTAATTQNTQQGGVKFGQAQQDRTGTQNLIGALPEGPLRNAVNLQFLGGLKVTPDEMRTPEERGQQKGAEGAATYFGGGNKVYEDQQRLQQKYAPPTAASQQQAPANTAEVTAMKPDAATANMPDPKSGGLTPNGVHQGGIAFALTGAMPSLGMSGNPNVLGARTSIINKGAALAAASGTDLATLRADYKANAGALANTTKQFMATDAASEAAQHNMQLALDQSPKVMRTGSPMVNRFVQWASGHELSGNPDLTKFETYIYTAAREYAKVTSGGAASVAALTDSAAREASKLLNAAQTPEAFQAAVQAMQDDMHNVKTSYLDRINKTSSTVANFLSAATFTPFEPTTSTAAATGGVAEGTQKPIPGIDGGVAEFRGGKWIRVK